MISTHSSNASNAKYGHYQILAWIWNSKNSHIFDRTTKWQATLEHILEIFTKQNILLAYERAILMLGFFPISVENYVHQKNCTQIFIASLSKLAKIWKPSRCPPTDECINKVVLSHNGILLSI
jgi:hypothetical protein